MKRLLRAAASVALAAFAFLASPQLATAQDAAVVEASKKESGIIIYSTLQERNWKPIAQAFNEEYPWIKIEFLRINLNNQIFDRYLAEASSKARTADILISLAPNRWLEFADKGELQDFTPNALKELPAFAHPRPGIFTATTEPITILYNKILLPKNLWPTGFKDLAEKVRQNPGVFKKKITAHSPIVSAYAMPLWWELSKFHGDAFWSSVEAIGPMMQFEQNIGTMLNKVLSGEYLVTSMYSDVSAPDPGGTRERVLGNVLFEDGQPVYLRGMGITKAASSPASAKLFVDFLLSLKGQTALGKGGSMPYHPKLVNVGFETYQDMVKRVGGESRMVIVGFDPDLEAKKDNFVKQLKDKIEK